MNVHVLEVIKSVQFNFSKSGALWLFLSSPEKYNGGVAMKTPLEFLLLKSGSAFDLL